MNRIYTFLGLFLWILSANVLLANNLQINNVTLTNDSTLTFDISWENSWRVSVAPNNHDAVWVFVKRKDCASGQWSHVDLSATTGDHSVASPLEVYVDGKDGGGVAKGVFVRRSTDGTGNISSTSVSLRMSALPVGQYDFRVFGIEMVQIPEGAYELGDGNQSTGSFKDGGTNNPLSITSEGALAVSTASGNIYTSSSTYRPVALPASYPKGFAEVYCMKHEISQGQYVDFVNLLTSDQATNRQVTGTANRLNITGTWPTLVANAPHRAMSFLAWADMLAYLDWAALRPMTELEFEKICRGPVVAVAFEYAWGSNIITDANTLVSDGTPSEAASNAITPGGGIANYNNNSILGPVRCGFAAKTATTRQEAGSGYYGVLDLSGNVWEQTVTTRNANGSGYTGNVGDGVISTTPTPGFANEASWPNVQASTGSTASVTGRAFRGGSWSTTVTSLRVSDRASVNTQDGRRINSYGGRGVR